MIATVQNFFRVNSSSPLTPPDPTSKTRQKSHVPSGPYHIVFSPADQRRSARQKPRMTSCAPQLLAQILFPTRPTSASRFEHRFTMFWLGRHGEGARTGSWEIKIPYRIRVRWILWKLHSQVKRRVRCTLWAFTDAAVEKIAGCATNEARGWALLETRTALTKSTCASEASCSRRRGTYADSRSGQGKYFG